MAVALRNKTSVVAPSVDQKFGQIEDYVQSVQPGTPVDSAVYGDLHQFFEKLMEYSGKTHNGLLESSKNGYQLFDALLEVMSKQAKPSFFTNRVNPVDDQYFKVTYGLGKFYAVTNGVQELSGSADGITWSLETIPTVTGAFDITYGNEILMIQDGLDGTLISTDGINWNPGATIPFALTRGITFLNGLFYAIDANLSLNHFATSVDGSSWTLLNTPNTVTIFNLTYGNGIYVGAGLAGETMRSVDGVNWTAQIIAGTPSINDITFGNGFFVGINATNDAVYKSTDGLVWTSIIIGSFAAGSIAFGRGRFIIVSNAGSFYSDDLVTWIPMVTNGNNWNDLIYKDGLFVAVARTGTGDRIMTSN